MYFYTNLKKDIQLIFEELGEYDIETIENLKRKIRGKLKEFVNIYNYLESFDKIAKAQVAVNEVKIIITDNLMKTMDKKKDVQVFFSSR